MANESQPTTGNRPGSGEPPTHRPDGKFAPGNRANPSGRPKDLHGFREMCRGKSELAVAKLTQVMLTSRNHLATVRACEILLAYAWGKPNQPLTDGEGGPLIPASKAAAIEALRAVVAASPIAPPLPPAVESPPAPLPPPTAEVGDAEPPSDPQPR